ncbi:hypothetical protein Vadar_028440 [Vaccinium darrowii]|uniref:Uncharacterized protein n=1 Tax=Vaccinium darrowii TaxID=229202 RepID=A0ACB7XKR5_9ERIC|nr:hypothetical protein Vadar_028440 [Vaccinium darrowii]
MLIPHEELLLRTKLKIDETDEFRELFNSQLLFSVVNKLLDGSIERKNGDVPQSMAFLLKKVVQEIERWVSTQAENFQKQNNLYKIHKEKCKPRVRVLETLTSGLSEENEVVMNQLWRTKVQFLSLG